MKTEVLIPETKHDNVDVQSGYTDMRQIFKQMDATARAEFCVNAMAISVENGHLEANDYIEGIMKCVNEEYTNLVRNGLCV